MDKPIPEVSYGWDLVRYGFPSGNEPRPVQCDDGYWIPWYVAQERIAAALRQSPGVAERDAVDLLHDLVTALEGAFISSWQSTHAWQKQLTAARVYLDDAAREIEGGRTMIPNDKPAAVDEAGDSHHG